MERLEVFSVVALLRDLPEYGLLRGQVGTIVDLHSPTTAEVEFSDGDGYTYAMTALPAEQLMILHHRPLGLVA